MPDIAQMTSELRGVPDQTLQSELANPTGLVPSYLVLAEAQRRQLMRQAAQKQQSQGQSSTVMQDVVRNMTAQQPPQGGPPAPAGMTPPQQGQGQPMPGAAPPNQMRMAAGGPLRLADGGADDESDDDQGDDYQAPSQGEASRAAPDDVDGWIQKYSTKYEVDPNLAHAVMKWESGGNQGAVSPKHARGLFQLEPGTAHDMGVDPSDPEQNVEGGIHYLGKLLKKYKGQETLALAAYNAGPGAVDKYGGVPPYKETLNYVPGVLAIRDQLQGQQRTGPLTQEQVEAGRMQMQPSALPPFPQGTPLTSEEQAAEQRQLAPNANQDTADLPQPTAFMSSLAPPAAPSAAPAAAVAASPPAPSRVMATPAVFNPLDPTNIERTRQMYYTLADSSPQLRQQLAADRAATIAQLQGMRNDAMMRYHNPNPWEFLGNIAAGMGASKQLSLPLMLGQGVGLAWQRQDEARKEAADEATALQGRIDSITSAGETERERMTQGMIGLMGQQMKGPMGQAEYDKYLPYFKSVGPMDPNHPEQGPPGMIGIPDPGHPGYGGWIDPKDMTKAGTARQPTALEMSNTTGIQQTLMNHPELVPLDANGQPRNVGTLRFNDLDPTIQKEAQWRAAVAKSGWTKTNVEGILADPAAPPDLKEVATAVQARETQQAGAMTTARTEAAGTEKAKEKSAQVALTGPDLTTQGRSELREQGIVGNQFDNLLTQLETLKDGSGNPLSQNNSNMYLVGPMAKYKIGIASPEGTLGDQLSNFSLASIQGMMPFASKSRNYRYIQDIGQHLPNVLGDPMHLRPPDSPQLIYEKLLQARRNLLRMDASTLRYENKAAGTKTTAPMLDDERGAAYLHLARGNEKEALRMAKEDGWQFPTQ